MEKLHEYLKTMTPSEQRKFADRCGTSLGYLRKAVSVGQKIGVELAVAIQRESRCAVLVEDLRSDVDWKDIRRTLAKGGK